MISGLPMPSTRPCLHPEHDCFARTTHGDCICLTDTDFGDRLCVFYKPVADVDMIEYAHGLSNIARNRRFLADTKRTIERSLKNE